MTRESFRRRYLLGVVLHVAVALVGCSRHADPRNFHPQILATCGAVPSFAAATELKRWERFPVDVYVDTETLPDGSRDAYRIGIARGVGLWAEATMGSIDAFRVNHDRPQSAVHVSIVPGRLPENAVGGTELTFAANRIVSATVRLTRSQLEDTPFLVHDVASTTAHEMGHVLGIVDHSPYSTDKMSMSGNFTSENRGRDPRALLTARDVNTLAEAYCR